MLKCKDIAVISNCKIVLLVKTALLEFRPWQLPTLLSISYQQRGGCQICDWLYIRTYKKFNIQQFKAFINNLK